MSKLNYYQVIKKDKNTEIFYGHSKKKIKEIYKRKGIEISDIEELVLNVLKKTMKPKTLEDIRKNSKKSYKENNWKVI